MRIKESIHHGDYRAERVFEATDLYSFRTGLSQSTYPTDMSSSAGNKYVESAWNELCSKGSGHFGWAVFTRVDI